MGNEIPNVEKALKEAPYNKAKPIPSKPNLNSTAQQLWEKSVPKNKLPKK